MRREKLRPRHVFPRIESSVVFLQGRPQELITRRVVFRRGSCHYWRSAFLTKVPAEGTQTSIEVDCGIGGCAFQQCGNLFQGVAFNVP